MRTKLTGLGIAFGIAALVLPAGAIEISTNAEFEVLPSFGGSIDDQDGTNTANIGTVDSFVEFGGSYFGGEVIFSSEGEASSSASDSGILFGSAFVDGDSNETDSMEFHASSSWSDTVTNSSGGTLNYDFDFLFDGGVLALGGQGGTAMFTLDILLDSASIWSRAATLTGNPDGGIADLLANGGLDDGGMAHTLFFDQNDDYIQATFDPFGGNLGLGAFGDGDSFDLTYNLEVWATSSDSGFVSASAGDPFGVGFMGTLNTGSSAPVPEPTTMALLGMGLLGMGTRRLRKKS